MRPGKIKILDSTVKWFLKNFQAPLDAQNRDRRTWTPACFGRELDAALAVWFAMPFEFHCLMGDGTRVLTESHLDPCSTKRLWTMKYHLVLSAFCACVRPLHSAAAAGNYVMPSVPTTSTPHQLIQTYWMQKIVMSSREWASILPQSFVCPLTLQGHVFVFKNEFHDCCRFFTRHCGEFNSRILLEFWCSTAPVRMLLMHKGPGDLGVAATCFCWSREARLWGFSCSPCSLLWSCWCVGVSRCQLIWLACLAWDFDVLGWMSCFNFVFPSQTAGNVSC